ncbi:MAG: O-antigen ligase family protein [Bacillota bacterium]|nr:O-antigen ligase family protein [Bacillota bacterium]
MKYILVIAVFAVYGVLVGIINGNSMGDIISNANVFVSILYVVILVVLINNDKTIINRLINLFTTYNAGIGLILYVVFKVSHYLILSKVQVVAQIDFIESKLHYGIISGYLYGDQYPRLYIANGIFLQIALAICMVKMAYAGKKAFFNGNTLKILLILMGIVTTGTRGYWTGAAVVGLGVILMLRKARLVPLIIKILIIMLCAGLALSDWGILSSGGQKSSVLQGLVKRAGTTTEFSSGEVSNNIRAIQIEYLTKSIKAHPIIGSGFGARIDQYEKETDRSGLNFELYYLELWFKTGLIGVLVLFAGFAHLLYASYKTVRSMSNVEEKSNITGWLIGFFSVAVTSATNPYFAGAHGFFVIVFLIVMLELYNENSEKIHLLELSKNVQGEKK